MVETEVTFITEYLGLLENVVWRYCVFFEQEGFWNSEAEANTRSLLSAMKAVDCLLSRKWVRAVEVNKTDKKKFCF